MGLSSAATFLVLRSGRNRVRAQLRRLRQPKYLIATLVGAAYIWLIFLRRVSLPDTQGPEPLEAGARAFVEGLFILGALVSMASGWLLGTNRSALQFTEAEIHFLFTGPCSRRQVLHYKLLRTIVVALVSAAVTTLLFGRTAGNALAFFVGSWLALSTLTLHLTGASLTREALAQNGRFGLGARLLTLLGFLLVLGAAVFWALWTPKPAMPEEFAAEPWIAYAYQLLESGPLKVLLWPIRAPIQVVLAKNAWELLVSLPAALLVLGLNYAWALSSDHAFEEGALRAAEERARRHELRRAGRDQVPLSDRARRAWFRLAPHGAPWWALVWKGAIATQRGMRLTLLPALIAVVAAAMTIGFSAAGSQSSGWRMVAGAACAGIAVLAALAGPSMLRVDLRRDLAQADVLRSLPLTGREVVIGEMAGPFIVLGAVQWLLWLLALVLTGSGFGLGWVDRVSICLAGAIAGPAVSAVGLVVHNAAALLFPAWLSPESAPQRGIEALGQRLLTFAASLLALVVGILPAAVVAGLVFLPLSLWAGWGLAAAPFAALGALAVLALEVYASTFVLGGMFNRLDVSE